MTFVSCGQYVAGPVRRNAELASITTFLGAGASADVGALILIGDAGVGKSALLDEAATSGAPAAMQS